MGYVMAASFEDFVPRVGRKSLTVPHAAGALRGTGGLSTNLFGCEAHPSHAWDGTRFLP